MTRRTTRIVAALSSIALVGSLAACSSRPSTAATVGDQRITVAEVNETIEEIPEAFKEASPELGHPSFVLLVKMRGDAAEIVGDAHGLNAAAEAEAFLAGRGGLSPEVAADPTTRKLLVDLYKADGIAARIGEARTVAEMGQVPLNINPKYGLTSIEFSESTPLVVDNSLSLPADG